jgi:hypothetical protein
MSKNQKIFLGVQKVINSKPVRKTAISFLAMLLLANAAALGADNELLRIVPADSLFCVQINNLDFTLSQTDQFLSGVLPIPMGTQMSMRMGLAQLFGNPALDGINTSGSFGVFANASGGKSFEEMTTIVIPVADYQKLVGSSQNLNPPDANGISNMNTGGFITQVGNYAFIKSPNSYNNLLALKKSATTAEFKSLASSLDSVSAAQAASGPLWIYCNMPEVQKTFGPQITAAFEAMKKQFEQMPPGAFGMTGPPAGIMNIYFDVIKGFVSQSKYVSLTIKPQPDCLSVGIIAAALPGTKMASLFTTDALTKKENKLRPYLQNGAMLNLSGNATNKLNSKIMKLYADWPNKKTSPEKVAKIQALANDIASVFNGNDAVSASIDPNSKPPFSELVVSEISDKDKFNKMFDQSAELINSGIVNDFYKDLGIPLQCSLIVKRGVENYNGVSIDSAVVSIKSADANSPEAQMIKQMYGDGITYRWAIVNNLFVCALGGDIDAKLKKLIDQVKAGGPTQVCSEVKDALALLPGSEKADFVATFNLVRCFDFLPIVMPMMPKINIPTKSNLVFAGRIDNGSATIDIAIPKTHLMEITRAVMMLWQNTQVKPTITPVPTTEQTGGPQELKIPQPTKPADANSKKPD